MTPSKVFFTGLTIDPNDLINRVHFGIIPADWNRTRFASAAPIPTVNRWLTEHIEGRWAIHSYYENSKRHLTIAFELSWDCSMFILSDGSRVVETSISIV